MDNYVWEWILAIVITLTIYAFLVFIKKIAEKRLKTFAQKTSTNLDDYLLKMLSSISKIFIFLSAINIGSNIVTLNENVNSVLGHAFLLILFWQITRWIVLVTNIIFTRYKKIKETNNDMHGVTAINGLTAISKFIIWLIFLMLAMDNLGVDITALVAGLGIGGLAIALAAQSILGDLFASLTIMIDKPIAIGDYVVVDNFMGNVKAIGIKSTKLESLTGEEIIISNSDLLNSRLRNYHQSRMKKRRSSMKIGIVYETNSNDLKRIQEILREIVKSNPKTEYIRAIFTNFGDFSLDFELTYNVLSPDYETLTEINHEIRLKIFETFEKEGLKFAYPTRTVHLTKEN
ncbi:mechanosensitive ion channel family protein [Desulfobacterota bacterium]|nr:mechanosensitive ion channel family protein [Thermodesulfobacteriota bacterium]